MRIGIKRMCESKHDNHIGNYRVENHGNTREFIYFRTAICVVNDEKKICYFDNGGYNTSSTNRNIGDYRYYFLSCKGYKEVTKDEFWRIS